jgi:tripartite-type tricarboxylate transporter receptor subunit TctC
MRRRATALCLFASLAVLACGGLGHAQNGFPARTVKFIVPFPPGGLNDVLARIVGDKLQAKWGQPVIVENKTGAAGNIGADFAAHSEPDGHTLLISAPGPLALNQNLYRQLSYRPEDFVPITVIGKVPNLIIVREELPVDSLNGLVEYLKANPGKAIVGSQGVGSTPHLTADMFMTMTGTRMVHVPYRGETLVLQDMLGGHVDVFFGNVSAALALWRDGRVKVLAVTDRARSAVMPDVPTTAEAGLPGLIATAWFAMAGPPKFPAALRDEIADAAIAAVKMPDVQEKLRLLSVEPVGSAPAETAAFFKDEAVRWGEVIRRTGAVVE